MTQEQKDLLLKDLSRRLRYGVKGIITFNGDKDIFTVKGIFNILFLSDTECCHVEDFKPYLFPLNSMTAEQLYELREMFGFEIEFGNGFIDFNGRLSYLEMDALFEWLDRNHFDYRELIPNGLALDASNLNIY